MKRTWATAVVLVLAAGAPAGQLTASRADVTVVMDGFREDAGVVRVALFAAEDGWPFEFERALKVASAPVAGYEAKVVFTDVPFGTYAVAAHHDENGNGVFDVNYFKVPTEGWGASNDAPGEMERIPFEAATFRVFQKDYTLFIKMRY